MGLNTRLHLAVDAHGMPVKFVLSEGGAADCLFAEALIADTAADKLLADKAYNTNAIRNLAVSLGMDAVIPPKTNRKKQLSFDRYLYRYRHLVENRFLDFNRWRGIATRYAKKLASFATTIEIRIIAMWLKIWGCTR